MVLDLGARVVGRSGNSCPFALDLAKGIAMPTQNHEAPARPPLLRLAGRLHEQLLTGRSGLSSGFTYALDNLAARVTQFGSLRHRLDLCQNHHLPLAAAKVLEELTDLLRSLSSEVDQVIHQIPPASHEHSILPLAELVKELAHLEEEFPDWRYDAANRELIVTTEPITLDDRYLGPFEIRLSLDRMGQSSRQSRYKVVAMEPHPAASNDAVTHPHVSDEHLCEGEAAAPINAALAEGRIGDFFILVNCVLTTYNPSSPYVALDAWEGTPCNDCGYITGDDSRQYCETCELDYCEECMSYCRCCDNSYCRSCLEECPACSEKVCSRCLKRCNECGKRCCESCLEEGLCPDCHKTPEVQGVPDESRSCSPTVAGAAAAGGKPAPLGTGESSGTEVTNPIVPATPRRRRRRSTPAAA